MEQWNSKALLGLLSEHSFRRREEIDCEKEGQGEETKKQEVLRRLHFHIPLINKLANERATEIHQAD